MMAEAAILYFDDKPSAMSEMYFLLTFQNSHHFCEQTSVL